MPFQSEQRRTQVLHTLCMIRIAKKNIACTTKEPSPCEHIFCQQHMAWSVQSRFGGAGWDSFIAGLSWKDIKGTCILGNKAGPSAPMAAGKCFSKKRSTGYHAVHAVQRTRFPFGMGITSYAGSVAGRKGRPQALQ